MANPLVANAEVVLQLVEIIDNEQYLFFVPVSTAWKKACGRRPQITRAVMAHTTVRQLLLQSVKSGLEQRIVCGATARIGRLDLLQCAERMAAPGRSHCTAKQPKGVTLSSWNGHGPTSAL